MPVRGLVHGHLSVRSILFATDFSPASYPASLYAVALAAHFECVLTLVHVFLPSQSSQEAEARGGIVSEQRRLLQQRLALTTSALAQDAGKATSVLLEGGCGKHSAPDRNPDAHRWPAGDYLRQGSPFSAHPVRHRLLPCRFAGSSVSVRLRQ